MRRFEFGAGRRPHAAGGVEDDARAPFESPSQPTVKRIRIREVVKIKADDISVKAVQRGNEISPQEATTSEDDHMLDGCCCGQSRSARSVCRRRLRFYSSPKSYPTLPRLGILDEDRPGTNTLLY